MGNHQHNNEDIWAEFFPDINLGNIIVILMIIGQMVYTYAVLSKDVEANTAEIIDVRSDLADFQESVRNTYVRKDVNQQILLRLEDMKESLDRLEQKIDDQ